MSQNYALDNDSEQGENHLIGLSRLFDPFTCDRIKNLISPYGKICWEVGAGNGSVAHWLANSGAAIVYATDIVTKHIPPRFGIKIIRHDLQREMFPVNDLDLIHTRLVLGHLPERDSLLVHLTGSLIPGGTIVIEEWDTTTGVGGVVDAPTDGLGRLYERYCAVRGQIFAEAGTRQQYGSEVARTLIRLGLQDVETHVHARTWIGGSPGSKHARATLRQFWPRLVERGMADAELDMIDTMLDDPALMVSTYPLYSTSGRAPLDTYRVER